MARLGIMLSLKGFFSHLQWVIFFHLSLGVKVKLSSKIVILYQDHHEKIKTIEYDLDQEEDCQHKKDL